jgi:hypothetical protein
MAHRGAQHGERVRSLCVDVGGEEHAHLRAGLGAHDGGDVAHARRDGVVERHVPRDAARHPAVERVVDRVGERGRIRDERGFVVGDAHRARIVSAALRFPERSPSRSSVT